MIANNENKQTNGNNKHLGHVNYKCVKNNVNSKEFISDIRTLWRYKCCYYYYY